MNRTKRLDIQALRAIAVLSVVIYHLWPNSLTGGFMGVDIFFVISGYLMTTTLIRDAQPVINAKKKVRSTGLFLINFYARRIKRLIPAASIVLLTTLGLVLATGNFTIIQETAKQISASALFFENWYLANNSVDYLANTDPTAVQHFWSLSLEEQFYFVWPLLLLILLLTSYGISIKYKKTKLVSLTLLPVLLLIAGFFAFGYHLTQTQASLAYFVTPARVWELLLGAAIALLPLLKGSKLRLLLPWVGTVMVGYAVTMWDGNNFPGWHALIPTIGTALIIYGGGIASESKWSFEQLLRFRPIQWIGNLSYSLYLWHWPLIILLPVLLFLNLDSNPWSFLIKIGILALSLIMAQLSYRYVEQSTQHIQLKKRYVYSGFLAITLLIAGLGFFVSNRVENTVQNTFKEVHAAAQNDSDLCVGARSIVNNCDKSFGYINSNYTQIATNDKYDQILSTGETCSSYDGRKNRPTIGDFCVVGDKDSKNQITVWGDSHAQHWINPMDKIGKENNLKINIIGTSYCFGANPMSQNCKVRFEKIKNSGVFDDSQAIIISMWHNANYTNKGNNLINAVTSLQSLTDNKNFYVLEDVPISGAEGGPECDALHQSCKNSFENATYPITKDSNDLKDLGVVTANRIIKVSDMFCDTTYCYSNIGGIKVYRDKTIGTNKDSINSHMTASFAYSTWQALQDKLKDAGVIK